MATMKYRNPVTGQIERVNSGGITDGTEIIDVSRIKDIENKFDEESQTSINLNSGINIIKTDKISPLDVKLYGNTLVNELGDSLNSPNLWTLDPGVEISSGELTINSSEENYQDARLNTKLKDNTCYIVILDILENTLNKAFSLLRSQNYGISEFITVPNSTPLGFYYTKFKTGIIEQNIFQIYTGDAVTPGGYVKLKNIAIYEISQELFDSIDVTLNKEDIKKMFPYVNSVQSVKNPYIISNSYNMIPSLYRWNNYSNVEEFLDDYKLKKLSGTSSITLPIIPNNTYSLSCDIDGDGGIHFDVLDENLKWVYSSATSNNVITYTINQSNAKYVRIFFKANNGEAIFSNMQFNLGQPKPFRPMNESYLKFDTILSGDEEKQDKIYYNNVNKQWEKEKHFENLILDGSLDWKFTQDFAGYKLISFETNIVNFLPNSGKVSKHNGVIIPSIITPNDSWTGDVHTITEDGIFTIGIRDIDSGWTESMTPSKEFIKAYFNGWKYSGNGTTHSWVSIRNYSISPSENTIEYVSSNMAENFKPYRLTYKLNTAKFENIYSEGNLNINGDSIIEVNEGYVRERVVPYLINDRGYINYKNSAPTHTSKRVEKYLNIYKDGIKVNFAILAYSNTVNNLSAIVFDFKPDSIYEVEYIAIGNPETSKIKNIDVTYQTSLKSSINSILEKQSDISTNLNINKKSIIEIWAILRGNNLI